MSDRRGTGGRADRPGGAGGPDPFEEGRSEAEALGDGFERLREDVRAVVRDEVAKVGMSSADLERMVRDAVGRELRRAPSGVPAWRGPALAGAGVVAGLLGVLGYQALVGGSPDDAGASTAGMPAGIGQESGAAPGPAPGSGPAGAEPSLPVAPEAVAALYDSLFDARSARLEGIVERLEAAGPVASEVTASIGAWRSGSPLTDGQRRRLHDALVQLALNEAAGAGLTLDGLLSRDPCRGNSCGALLELWRTRGEELGMPELRADPASDTPTLAVAEKVLVLRRAGGSGG